MTRKTINVAGFLPGGAAASLTLYKCPIGKQAVVANVTYHNTNAAARTAVLQVQVKGSDTATELATPTLAARLSAGDDWSTSEERWVLAEGTELRGYAQAASDVGYFVSVLEFDA